MTQTAPLRSAEAARLCLALADHVRASAADIARLERACARHLPQTGLADTLVVELQSFDRVGQALDDVARMLERLAEPPSNSRSAPGRMIQDVVTAAHLRSTRETMMQRLAPNGQGISEPSAPTAAPGAIDLF